MNFLFTIDFPWGKEYLSLQTVTVGGKQFVGRVTSCSEITRSMRLRGNYQVNDIDFSIEDLDGRYRDYIQNARTTNANRLVYGRTVEIAFEDGHLSSYRITDAQVGENSLNIRASELYGELEAGDLPLEMITPKTFPDSPDASFGNCIPVFYGPFEAKNVDTKGFGAIKAWNIGNDRYLVGEGLGVITYSAEYIVKPDYSTATGATLNAPDGNVDYWYISYTGADEDFLLINLSVSATPTAKSIIEEFAKFALHCYEVDVALLDADFTKRHYDTPELAQATADPHFAIFDHISAQEVLRSLSEAFEVFFWFDSILISGVYKPRVIFSFFDHLDASYADSFQQPEIDLVGTEIVPEILNSYDLSTAFDINEGSHKVNDTFYFKISSRDWGVERRDELQTQVFPYGAGQAGSRVKPFVTLLLRNLLEGEPQRYIDVIVMNPERLKSLSPGDTVAIRHDRLAEGFAKGLILDIGYNPVENSGRLYMLDVTRFDYLDKGNVFLFQPDSIDGDRDFFDTAPAGFNFQTGRSLFSNPVHSDTVTKFGDTSAYFDLQWLEWGRGRAGAFEVFSQTNFIIFTWVKFTRTGSNEYICGQFKDSNNYWHLRKSAADVARFQINTNGTNKVLMVSTTTLGTTSVYGILIAKIGNQWGLYLNGTQEAHAVFSTSFTFGEPLLMGAAYDGASYVSLSQFYLPCLYISHDNARFGVNPVVGLTDTHTLPTEIIRYEI